MIVLRWLWRWSLLLTVPVTILFGYWAIETYRHFRSFGIDYDARPVEVSLRQSGLDNFWHLVRGLRLRLLPNDSAAVPASERLRTIQLFVQESELARLNADLPHSGFEYVRGHLWYDGGPQPVKIKYRGDFMPHWGYPKKSLRVRTRKNALFEGMRSFNLLAPKWPEQLNNYLGYRLAHAMGLLAPRVELVNVTLNGRHAGFHVLVEQLDEGTLRYQDRMPGDLYSGELIAKDRWRGTTNLVFEHPALWEKSAINNHYPPESRAPLEELLRLINQPINQDRQRRLSELLDMEQWGRFAAFELLTQTDHYDRYHNWRLFYDPWRTRFEPVVWDPIAWGHVWRPKRPEGRAKADMIVSRLHVWLHENPDFLRARHEALRRFFAEGVDRAFLVEADRAFAAVRHAARFDPDLRPPDEEFVDRRMTSMREFIGEVLEDLRREYVDAPQPVLYSRVEGSPFRVRVRVRGRQPVDALELRFLQEHEGVGAVTLRYRTAKGTEEIDLRRAVAVRGSVLQINYPLLCQRGPRLLFTGLPLRSHHTRELPTSYELELAGVAAANRLLEVAAIRSGSRQVADETSELPLYRLDYLDLLPPADRDLELWSGEMLVEGVREVDNDVLLEAGTRIRLAPGAAILFRGRLIAEGTAEEPILFGPARPGQAPWGTIALVGRGADGSQLRHCRFESGSGIKEPLAEYSAMFSVHEVHGVSVRDCLFRESLVVDDMVHTVYSDIEFVDCAFENALFDAVDLDISSGTFVRCRFSDSGNDEVDLMTTKCTVIDSVFERGGDKGISIGEGSRLLAVRTVFRGCNIGVQAKDGSVAVVANADFEANNLAADAYKKNWRYAAGGNLTILKSVLADNRNTITCDRHSRIEVIDSYLDGEVDEPPDQVMLTEVDASRRSRSASGALPPLPSRLDLGARGRQAWSLVRPALRGARIGDSQER